MNHVGRVAYQGAAMRYVMLRGKLAKRKGCPVADEPGAAELTAQRTRQFQLKDFR
jgi:hypothetical protein